MKNKLLVLAEITLLSFFTWNILSYSIDYFTLSVLDYKPELTPWGVDSEMRRSINERTQRHFEGHPLPADPVFERHKMISNISVPLVVALIGFAGCMIIWFARRGSKWLSEPLKWVWVFLAMYLLQFPYTVTFWFIKKYWIGKPFCWPGDMFYIGYLDLNPYIFSPIIAVLMLVCLGTALYKALVYEHR